MGILNVLEIQRSNLYIDHFDVLTLSFAISVISNAHCFLKQLRTTKMQQSLLEEIVASCFLLQFQILFCQL